MSGDADDLAQLEAFLEEHLGLSRASLHLGAELEQVLRRRAEERRCATLGDYLEQLSLAEFAREELRAIAEHVTVGESYFFREPHHIDAFLEIALPERLSARSRGEPVRVLCAGCAAGEEAYSLAIAIHTTYTGLGRDRVKIHGVDVNPDAIRRAQRARYTPWTLRATPEDLRARGFTSVGKDVILRSEFRDLVTFEERNLIEEDPDFWEKGAFDVIFCRNVLMYLSQEKARAVLARFARALVPRGFLFLASTESLRAATSAFERVHARTTFYYRSHGSPPGAGPAPAAPSSADAFTWHAPWQASIQQASSRVAEVAQRAASSRRSPLPEQGSAGPHAASLHTSVPRARVIDAPAAHVSVAHASVDRVLSLLGEERFDEAMAALRALPSEALTGARIELLRAVLLCHRGDYAEAERAAARALTAGDRGGGYYVLGLCREQSGDPTSAAQQYLSAALLDPTFAMPHLRLGLLAKRAGDHATAEVELARAGELFENEQQERLTLFGGGFHREALVGLCEVELRGKGDRT